MTGWRAHHCYSLVCYTPFYRAMADDDAKRVDLVGPIPGGVAPNQEFTEIMACAERIGLRPRIPERVPALENIAMRPAEKTCKACLRRGSSNLEDGYCRKKENQGLFCNRWMWDRRTPASPYRKPTKKRRACMCEDDDGEGCE